MLLLVIFGFIMINALLVAYIYFNQDDLKVKLIDVVNHYQKGKITAEKIFLSPFKHFPRISIELDGVRYFESDSIFNQPGADPVCRFDQLYIAIDIFQILSGSIRISEVTAEEGEINLKLYPDSSLNLLNAIASRLTRKSLVQIDSLTEDKPIDLDLQRIHLANVKLEFENDLRRRKNELYFDNLTTRIEYARDSLQCQLISDFTILGIEREKRIYFKNQEVSTQIEFLVDMKKKNIQVRPSRLILGGANFDIQGHYNLNNNPDFHIEISGSDQGVRFYQLMLQEEIINKNMSNLTGGNIYFDGIIEGRMNNDFIFAEFNFGVKDLKIDIAQDVEPVNYLKLDGFFTTGRNPDFSQAKLQLQNLTADLPGGYIKGNLEISNFLKPGLIINLDAKADLGALSRAIKIGRLVDHLRGRAEIEIRTEDHIESDTRNLFWEVKKFKIELDSVSCRLVKNNYLIDNLDGTIDQESDRILLKNLKVQKGYSDFILNGYINNLMYLILNRDSDVYANLDIFADRLLIKDILNIDSTASFILNDSMSAVHLKASLNSDVRSILSANKFPAGEIRIHELSGRLQSLPDLSAGHGGIRVKDYAHGIDIGFESIALQTKVGNVKVNGHLFISDSLEQKIDFKTSLKIPNVSTANKEMGFWNLDHALFDSLNGEVKCDFNILLLFTADRFKLKQFTLNNGNLDYTSHEPAGRSGFKNVHIDIRDSDISDSINIMESYTGSIHFGRIDTGVLQTEDIGAAIKRYQQGYEITPQIENLFGGHGAEEEGIFTIDLADSIPAIRYHYQVNQFRIGDFMENMTRSKLIAGRMNLVLDGTSKGKNLNDLIRDGHFELKISGNNLTLYGIDIDQLLLKIQRVQSINLVDISAYFIVGPFAPLATKGFDLAKVVTTSTGKQSHVKEFISNWQADNGMAVIKDAALSTAKNRLAANGQIDIINGRLIDVTVAVLDPKGCSLISQTVNGSFSDLKFSDLKAVGPIRGTLDNLIRAITGSDCKPFYTGTLAHPN